jgi:hypothetical protein
MWHRVPSRRGQHYEVTTQRTGPQLTASSIFVGKIGEITVIGDNLIRLQ